MDENLFPEGTRKQWNRVFYAPGRKCKIDALFDEGYYSAAQAIVAGVVNGTLSESMEGVVGLHLFRHYLELALKHIIFHARWLKDPKTNARDHEIAAVRKSHSLGWLWAEAKKECNIKLDKAFWNSIDRAFIDKCIADFDKVDPEPGDKFRYPVKQFKVSKRSGVVHYLGTNYGALLGNMQHAKDVLEAIDTFLINTHGRNEDWESDLNSL